MSDFGELCPLFSTGVFSDTTFPNIPLTAVSTSQNALLGTLTCGTATRSFWWKFGRTVVVTGGFVRCAVRPTFGMNIKINHYTTVGAAGTEFATCYISITTSGMEVMTWMPWNDVTEKTFTSDEVLGFTVGTSTTSGGGTIDLMVRYKEK